VGSSECEMIISEFFRDMELMRRKKQTRSTIELKIGFLFKKTENIERERSW
jgi:hypothetical protein